MVARKRPVHSGPNIPDEQRHTVPLKIRCQPLLAARARALARKRALTLADVLEAGCEAVESEKP